MPACGSQIVLCSLPVRLDTYRGCGHGCAYCFAARKMDLASVGRGEGVQALRDWIAGKRTTETNWCDWNLPLHWGGLSDPFQPIEREQRRSLACLDVLAESGYPVVISTKGGPLLAEPEYRARLKAGDVAVQVSMTAPALDPREPGAPSFTRRLGILAKLAKHVRRLLVRCQPYMPELLGDVLRHLPRYKAAGVHGVTVEGLKNHRAMPGLARLGTDFVYPVDVLRHDFELIRARCHELGLAFYAAENRLRNMGDDPCCCGVADLPGWRVNRANLSALVFGRRIRHTRQMQVPGTAGVFKALAQNAVSTTALRTLSYFSAMEIVRRVRLYREIMGLRTSPGAGCADRSSGQSCTAGRSDGASRRRNPDRGRSTSAFVANAATSARDRPAVPRARNPRHGTGISRRARRSQHGV